MLLEPGQFIGGAITGLLATVGAYAAIRSAVAEIRVWTTLHQQRDDERHTENQRRLSTVEDRLEDSTRRDMREATRLMSMVAGRLNIREDNHG